MKSYEELQAERDALAAHLAAIQQAWACAGRWPDSPTQLTNLAMAIEATPQQHLAEIRAEAGRAGFVEGLRLRSKGPCLDFEAAANQYADQIRRSEVE